MYARYFSEHTSAAHIVFCYSLWRSVTEQKAALTVVPEADQTSDDREALDYLRKRGSLHLLVAAVAGAAEVYLDRALPDTFEFSFGKGRGPAAATEDWAPLLDALLPFASGQLGPVFDGGGLRRKEAVVAGINNFRAVVASTKRANREVFEEFRAKVSGVTI